MTSLVTAEPGDALDGALEELAVLLMGAVLVVSFDGVISPVGPAPEHPVAKATVAETEAARINPDDVRMFFPFVRGSRGRIGRDPHASPETCLRQEHLGPAGPGKIIGIRPVAVDGNWGVLWDTSFGGRTSFPSRRCTGWSWFRPC